MLKTDRLRIVILPKDRIEENHCRKWRYWRPAIAAAMSIMQVAALRLNLLKRVASALSMAGSCA